MMTQHAVTDSGIAELSAAEIEAVSGGIIIVGGLPTDWDGDWCGTRWPRIPFPRPRTDLAEQMIGSQ
jgi:hypothetical protein